MHTPFISVDLVSAALRTEEFSGTSRTELERAARDYGRFLLLCQRYPALALAPTKAIDKMWHLHMQHPRAYVADCIRLLGDILDHDGGFGTAPREAPILAATFARTSALWEREFGEPYVGGAHGMVKCTRNCVSRCRRACKSATLGASQ